MLKNGIKNYFKSLRYFFTPLGTMFLGMMLGFSALIPSISSAISSLINGISKLSEDINFDVNMLIEGIWGMVKQLDWQEPINAVKTMISAGWIKDVLMQSLSLILGKDFEVFRIEITALIEIFITGIVSGVVVFFLFWILGFFAGFIIVKVSIRRKIAKRTLWKYILSGTVESLVVTGLVLVCIWIFTLWKPSIYISVIIVLMLVGLFSLIYAYFMHGYKKVKFFEIVNARNAGLYILTNLIIFAVSVIMTLIAVSVNVLMGIFVGLSLIEIAIIVINLNAEAYVKNAVESPDNKAKNITATIE